MSSLSSFGYNLLSLVQDIFDSFLEFFENLFPGKIIPF
ncbi:hypothetical protein FRC0316_01930 [Corynebacterium diphtheriae]|nr:hypothetical protein FRC0016_01853 [Corynebacterium diphtheriae]CAB0811443.1 hypothetical protein FRC0213_01856 [Corynebacterium diphtheriae]CAB0813772.1 hypothetical protein FRC0191_01963 [Corynebacterium diphtheriae]CAB0857922.1 hypothetical protein FRC0316_01930 [Corynebacterium diphtheriae]CAB0858506.1 hypothetical protein FRC0295_01907 [Corynebacterium diphtheriae]